ncbi:MAG: Kae1-associated kinase Bud32, partial [Fervidicoccaceae archaeon]
RPLEPLAWGAESNLYLSTYMGRRVVVKIRFLKPYMDSRLARRLVYKRTVQEAKILFDASRAGVRAPLPLYVDPERGLIVMEYLRGPLLRDELGARSPEWAEERARELGEVVRSLHNADIIHGDLTTSNVIVSDEGPLYLIDFGLSYYSGRPEDKAVDIRVLERAVSSTHPSLKEVFMRSFLESYSEGLRDWEEISESYSRLTLMGRYVRERRRAAPTRGAEI